MSSFAMPKLQTLPTEIILRIIDEVSASGFGQSNPLYSLILVSKQFCALALPYLYCSITINNFDQLEHFLNGQACRSHSRFRMKHIHITIPSHSECTGYLDQGEQWDEEMKLCRRLGDLIHSSLPGYLKELSVVLLSTNDHSDWYKDPVPCAYFRDILHIKAETVECMTANPLSEHIIEREREVNEDETEDDIAEGIPAVLRENIHLVHFKIPFLSFANDRVNLLNTLVSAKQLKTLHLIWPIKLDSQTVGQLLYGLQDSLVDKGLVIAGPASLVYWVEDGPRDVDRMFQENNPDLSLVGIRAELARSDVDVQSALRKLDWRISLPSEL